ncbi:MAG TPA: exosortase/archaeosortase family protein [Chthoniobacterales bacterium]|jgi:eight transmembrane protein EpsH (proposed exosortase)|nr:exosortase/archaeosortase family protein [Chthoniobacterales bacterium]
MDEAIATASSVSAPTSKRPAWFIVLVIFGVIWFELINQLKPEWWLNPQYNYGLIVPLLAIYLFWKRWRTRPTPSERRAHAFALFAIFAGAALFLPIRFLSIANPDWRLLSWMLAVDVAAISLLYLYLIGGRIWARYFAFPILFFLVAVPWPVRIEQTVVQDLMRIVTAINVTFLQLAGVPALQHGNVIEVGAGFIGIEEACSGVRSLQATLMISLFLGELYSFRLSRRLILIVTGVFLAFICNVVRTAILVWVGTTRGTNAIEAWHDPAGLTILMVCLFGLWIVSLIMMRRGSAFSSAPKIDNEAGGSRATSTGKPERVAELGSEAINQRAPIRMNWAALGALAIWFLLAEAGVQLWYASHKPSASSRWSVSWPEAESNYKKVPIAPEAETLLRFSEGGGASWNGDDGHQWLMFFFKWAPGRTAARFVKVHRPDICLPASGRTMEADKGIRVLAVNGVNVPIRSYRFSDRGSPLHVFYCYWDARSSYESVSAAVAEDWSPRGRLRSALQGRREIGAQSLELIVWGYQDDAEAEQALARELAAIIRSS